MVKNLAYRVLSSIMDIRKVFAARTASEDPLQAFKFRVTVPGLPSEIGFKSCKGLNYETEVVEYDEGSWAYTHKLPGRGKVQEVTLERGCYADLNFRDLVISTLTAKDFIDVVRLHAEDGVDFVTLHCGITRHTIDQIKKHKRKMNIVSRGGSLVFAWMSMTGNENPFYEYYDEILEICREHDVTISLGDACRPGYLADASDVCQIEELVRLGELTKRAWAKDVQVMVEGPGHMPMDQIAANMKIQQTICMGAPFYVLGPLVTDIAPGYDHITSAIGGAIAAQNGAAFLCYVTPAEHLALPNVDDVKQGIIASKIAAHAADIAKGVKGAMDIDNKMADARRRLDWDAQWECSLDPETAKAIRDSRAPEHDDTCSMCGKFCAVRSMNKALAGEHVDIL